jgi:nucleoside-diphosphate-sugar epimerase
MTKKLVFITGAAGLVGQNLIAALCGNTNLHIVAVDKHAENTAILRKLHPHIEVIEADLSEAGSWQSRLGECDFAVFLHAQIGGLDKAAFTANNVTATEMCLEAMRVGNTRYLIHISSSVVNSQAVDYYTESKKAQELIVAASEFKQVILRPTLMFGWFDRKHLGWLKRFMERVPVFPIPGHGRYLRQPLYAGDLSAIIASCLHTEIEGKYNISGRQKVHYIEMIRKIRGVIRAKSVVLTIPYFVFWMLLKTYAVFDRNPPFTVSQLKALITPDMFEVIDWPGIFQVEETPLDVALEATFLHPEYSKVSLKF